MLHLGVKEQEYAMYLPHGDQLDVTKLCLLRSTNSILSDFIFNKDNSCLWLTIANISFLGLRLTDKMRPKEDFNLWNKMQESIGLLGQLATLIAVIQSAQNN